MLPHLRSPSPGRATAGAFPQGSVVTTFDEYRRHSEQARKLAAEMLREDDKVFWLKMAGDWERLAQLAYERRQARPA
jgi:hypothetical protein